MSSGYRVVAYNAEIRVTVPPELTHKAAIDQYVAGIGFFEEQRMFIERLNAHRGPCANAPIISAEHQRILNKALDLQRRLTDGSTPEERLAELLRAS